MWNDHIEELLFEKGAPSEELPLEYGVPSGELLLE